MALLRMESFDTFADANTLKVFTSYFTSSGVANPVVTAGVGRRGTQGLRCQLASNQNIRALALGNLGASGSTCIFGTAFSVNQYSNAAVFSSGLDLGASGSGQPNCLFGVRRAGAGNTVHQVWFRLNTDGTITALRGQSTEIATSTGAILSGSLYQHLEFKVVINSSSGMVGIRLYGVPILNATGVNTQGDPGGTDWSQIIQARLSSTSGTSAIWDYDDQHVLDGTTTADDPRNDYLGDCRCDANYAESNGTDTDGTPSGGAVDQFTMEDELLADGDTTYNTLAAAGDKDSYNYSAPVAGATYYGVQARPWWRKTDAGTCTGRAYVNIGGTRYYGGSKSPAEDYLMQPHVWAQKPSDSSDWTDTDIDAAEFGDEKET